MVYRIRHRSSEDDPAITTPHFLVTKEEDMTGEVLAGDKTYTFEDAVRSMREMDPCPFRCIFHNGRLFGDCRFPESRDCHMNQKEKR